MAQHRAAQKRLGGLGHYSCKPSTIGSHKQPKQNFTHHFLSGLTAGPIGGMMGVPALTRPQKSPLAEMLDRKDPRWGGRKLKRDG